MHTNEEKAKELALQYHKGCKHSKSAECNAFANCENCYHYVTAMQMAEWKDKEFYCYKNIKKIITRYCLIRGIDNNLEYVQKLHDELKNETH